MNFNTMISNMQNLGFYDFVLPWLLFLCIIYVIMLKAPFLQDREVDKKRVSILIAAIISFFIINYPVAGSSFGVYLTVLFGNTGMYIAAGLVLIILLGMFGINIGDLGEKKYIGWTILLAVIILFLYGGSTIGTMAISSSMLSVVFVVLLMLAAMYFISG
ncbi:MAG: hypothetical protein KAR87_00360 [Candidatus Aenigmarchaeota archaeon]|nr:hypothetical protein [Candidatus Aenigmarchaeota archaeon]